MQLLDERTLDCHWLLLRLAGWIPDDTLAQSRRFLAEDNLVAFARSVVHACVVGRVLVRRQDLYLLGEVYELEGADPVGLALLDPSEERRIPPIDFAATRTAADQAVADAVAAAEQEYDLEQFTQTRPWPVPVEEPAADPVERALVATAETGRAVRGVWRAWRYPLDGAPWPPPRRVFLAETDQGANLPAIAARLQDAVDTAGTVPVEVVPMRADLPAYQHRVRGSGALLWSATPDPGVRVAELFDSVDPVAGGRMAADHPTLGGPERERVAQYLAGGEPLLVNPEPMEDVVDPGRGAVVPASFRTDGFWVWNDAAGYYLERHRLSPDPHLVAHVRARDYVPPDVDGAAMHRADAALARFFAQASATG